MKKLFIGVSAVAFVLVLGFGVYLGIDQAMAVAPDNTGNAGNTTSSTGNSDATYDLRDLESQMVADDQSGTALPDSAAESTTLSYRYTPPVTSTVPDYSNTPAPVEVIAGTTQSDPQGYYIAGGCPYYLENGYCPNYVEGYGCYYGNGYCPNYAANGVGNGQGAGQGTGGYGCYMNGGGFGCGRMGCY